MDDDKAKGNLLPDIQLDIDKKKEARVSFNLNTQNFEFLKLMSLVSKNRKGVVVPKHMDPESSRKRVREHLKSDAINYVKNS
jgi:hypothetical protein